jgi:hypothetical protein
MPRRRYEHGDWSKRACAFVEITCPTFDGNNSPWDQHGQLRQNHAKNARVTDQSVAALITDLDQRGLLDETIVLWAGEMGRTPHTPKISDTAGRDHHVNGYSIFMAGGGFKGGTTFGETDEFGNAVATNPLSIHDIHATLLHQMGIDHEKLTFRHGGRDQRLTDVHGRVVKGLVCYDFEKGACIWQYGKWGHPGWTPDSLHIFEMGNVTFDIHTGKYTKLKDVPNAAWIASVRESRRQTDGDRRPDGTRWRQAERLGHPGGRHAWWEVGGAAPASSRIAGRAPGGGMIRIPSSARTAKRIYYNTSYSQFTRLMVAERP